MFPFSSFIRFRCLCFPQTLQVQDNRSEDNEKEEEEVLEIVGNGHKRNGDEAGEDSYYDDIERHEI